MSVPIEFVNIVVRRSALDRLYPGGSAAFIEKNSPFDGRVRAYDDHLVKFGAMSSADIESIASYFQTLGLIGLSEVKENPQWIDFCVVDQLFGPTHPCDWISYDQAQGQAAFRQKRELE